MKQYLSQELIKLIEEKATDPIWKMGVLAGGYKTWYSIIAVSPNDLVHFYGNSDTGWQHVMSRHSYYSNDIYFGEGALGEPSRFQPLGLPIFDWVRIADDVFTGGVLDEKYHPEGELFVKYKGQSNRYEGSNGEMKEFSLILYRGTKIVHSIFPKKHMQRSKVPQSKLQDLKRTLDHIRTEKNPFSAQLIIRIPYVNNMFIERYVVVACIDLNTMEAKVHLQVNHLSGIPAYSMPCVGVFTPDLEKKDADEENIELTRYINTFCKYTDFKILEEVMEKAEVRVFGKG